MTIVTAHQPNWLPGESVIRKIEASDIVLWLDEVQYTKGGYTNRNRLPDGSWLTIPVERVTDGLPINRVRISEHGGWRRRHIKAIKQAYGESALTFAIAGEISRPYRLLVGLNLALLRLVCPQPPWVFQSHLDGGRAVVSVSEDEVALRPISERLAMMVEELGGDTYLSGPSGFRYLDETPFLERGIRVDYFEFQGPNPCVLERLSRQVSMP